MYELMFSDLDETLLTSDHHVPPINRQAIALARKKGLKFIPATGRGYEMTDDETEADVIIVNTCCFIHDAREESISGILEMAGQRKNGRCRALVVTGCLAQRYGQEILDEIPEVDEVLGTTAYDKILDAVEKAKQRLLANVNFDLTMQLMCMTIQEN